MSNEAEFVNGLIVKAPHDNAPEYVKAKLSFNIDEMIAWLETRKARGDKWANADVKVSQGGKWYAAVDNWKPESNGGSSGTRGGAPQRERPARATDDSANDFVADDIPFLSQRGNF